MNKFLIVVGVIIVLAILLTILLFVVWPISSPPKKTEDAKPEGNAALYVSTDGGSAWEALDSSRGLTPSVFEFKKNDPAQFYIGTKGKGLWLARDGGRTITQVKDPKNVLLDTADVYGISQDEKGDTLYLAVYQNNYGRVLRLRESGAEELYSVPIERYLVTGVLVGLKNEKKIWVSSSDGNFLESLDGGTTWEIIASTRESFKILIRHPTEDGTFWAVTEGNKLYTTDSGGRLWHERAKISIEDEGQRAQAKVIYELEYNPYSRSLMAASDYGIIESIDNGKSWHTFRTPLPPASIHVTAVRSHPLFGEVFWVGASNQIYRTDDGGITWSKHLLPVQGTITMLQVDSTNPKRIYAGLSY